jgi:subtilisin family serine protease
MRMDPYAAGGIAVTPDTDRLPVPRGVAFSSLRDGKPETQLQVVRHHVRKILEGWEVHPVEGLPGWYESTPPRPVSLAELWSRLRDVRDLPSVDTADPLFVVRTPGQGEQAIGLRGDEFGLWGWPYDNKTREAIERSGKQPDWHVTQMRVSKAWSLWRRRRPGRLPGDGIIVGHPDTGYTSHTGLAGKLVPGHSFIAGDDGGGLEAFGATVPVDAPIDPTAGEDPLDAGFLRNPGHGTATASVIVSGDAEVVADKKIYGIAPGARVMPLRVSSSVIHFDFSNVGKAIVYAADHGADVISMSLGGPLKSDFLHACIEHAISKGVVIISAAGNYIPTVVFPAAFPEVVAVSATHAAGEPWRMAGLGGAVDISAPGEGVWCARTRSGESGLEFISSQGSGTSFATANVAGLAALWLSYWGGRAEIAKTYGNRLDLVPFAFQYQLTRTADDSPDFVERSRHGAGIPDAVRLLEVSLPKRTEVERFAEIVRKQGAGAISTLTGIFTGWLGVTGNDIPDLPSVSLAIFSTIGPDGKVTTGPAEETDAVRRAKRQSGNERALLQRLLGDRADELSDELVARIASDRSLFVALQQWRPGESMLPLFYHLMGGTSELELSAALRETLTVQRANEEKRREPLYRGRLEPPMSGTASVAGGPPPPALRHLRAYAFDPSQETSPDTSPISQVMIPVRWESLNPGPIGEYLEVVDIDPASGCVYSPVDLDHPHILAQDGLAPSEGNPQFHQQMVYAVAMNTIQRFELALGRPMFWRPIRPWLSEQAEEKRFFTPESLAMPNDTWISDRFVQRLRIYPHALREANAYYSPAKRALMFGYFPGSTDPTGKHYPGGMVFSCLSHDIIVHETTHALIDGIHPYYTEQAYGDTWAFHEGFADVIALFQHFTYPEVLRHQIARTRGDLQTNNLLAQLAQQFGQTTQNREALRSALGREGEDGVWRRKVPNPRALEKLSEHHERGSILVAAIFDAFLKVYNGRVADLYRLATGGTGVIPAGQIHPDLVSRLAVTAANTAEDILTVCIRALDYLPPVDIDFGEFLRALVTADLDVTAADRREVRVAFIDAFRAWGIYPENVMTLSEESLRWRGQSPGDAFTKLFPKDGTPEQNQELEGYEKEVQELRIALERWQPGESRMEMFQVRLKAQRILHRVLQIIQAVHPNESILPGLDLRPKARFGVSNLRLARRTGERGQFRNELIAEVVQTTKIGGEDGLLPQRGGATLVVDLSTWRVRYVIYKRLYQRLPGEARGDTGDMAMRITRVQAGARRREGGDKWRGEAAANLVDELAETYGVGDARPRESTERAEPFALLHRSGNGLPFR